MNNIILGITEYIISDISNNEFTLNISFISFIKAITINNIICGFLVITNNINVIILP